MESRTKRSVAFFFRSRLDSQKRHGTPAGLSPSKQQALLCVPMEASRCCLARSATMILSPVGAEERQEPDALQRDGLPSACGLLPCLFPVKHLRVQGHDGQSPLCAAGPIGTS